MKRITYEQFLKAEKGWLFFTSKSYSFCKINNKVVKGSDGVYWIISYIEDQWYLSTTDVLIYHLSLLGNFL